jgi:carbonic anhydrase/acetyltransferase-like protein (isoleucine patch superfamily)
MARLNQNIVIPDNTRLEKFSEFSNSEIITIQFGQSVEISGNYIFARCHHILEVEIPNGTNISGYGTFYCSNRLQNLRIGQNVCLSGNYILQDCPNLESISIGHSTTISGNHCLSGLRSLQRLQFAPNTTFSGYYLFNECENIREVIIPDNCTISSDFFFRRCSRLERIVIGNNVVIQGSQCFFECTGVRSVTIGDNVTISGLKFLDGCFVNQNVEITIGQGYMGYPIHIPLPILHVRKFADVKSDLRFEAKKCAISMEKFEDDSDVVVLKCGHVFLVEPLQQWIGFQKICATCRNGI